MAPRTPAPPGSGDTPHTLTLCALSLRASALLSALWALLPQAAPCSLPIPAGASPGLADLSSLGAPWTPSRLLQTPHSQACQQPTPQPLASETRFPSFPGCGAQAGAGPEALLPSRPSSPPKRALAALVQGGFIPGTPLDTLTPPQPQGARDGSCQTPACRLGPRPISEHVGGCSAPGRSPPGLSCNLSPRPGRHQGYVPSTPVGASWIPRQPSELKTPLWNQGPGEEVLP